MTYRSISRKSEITTSISSSRIMKAKNIIIKVLGSWVTLKSSKVSRNPYEKEKYTSRGFSNAFGILYKLYKMNSWFVIKIVSRKCPTHPTNIILKHWISAGYKFSIDISPVPSASMIVEYVGMGLLANEIFEGNIELL